MSRSPIFISHASKDDAFVRELRQKLEGLGLSVWVDSRNLRGADVDGHGDHRVIMALAIAGSLIPGRTVVHGSEAVSVTFPAFAEALRQLGGKISVES
jgi:3-phosphoshikimate 1-carboxyvinyltransferase